MPDVIRLTRELIKAGGTAENGFKRAQLQLLGVPWPPTKGWLSALVGTEIPLATYEAFVAMKGAPKGAPKGTPAPASATPPAEPEPPSAEEDELAALASCINQLSALAPDQRRRVLDYLLAKFRS